jgi:hypothetical protein
MSGLISSMLDSDETAFPFSIQAKESSDFWSEKFGEVLNMKIPRKAGTLIHDS